MTDKRAPNVQTNHNQFSWNKPEQTEQNNGRQQTDKTRPDRSSMVSGMDGFGQRQTTRRSGVLVSGPSGLSEPDRHQMNLEPRRELTLNQPRTDEPGRNHRTTEPRTGPPQPAGPRPAAGLDPTPSPDRWTNQHFLCGFMNKQIQTFCSRTPFVNRRAR